VRYRAVVLEDDERSAAGPGEATSEANDDCRHQPAINAAPNPATRTSFARQVWRVRAQIVEYKLEDDEDIHFVLFDQGKYLIAEMPASSCLSRRTRARAALVRVRQVFEQLCGPATDSWRDLGAVVDIAGAKRSASLRSTRVC
jgi:hypothetical protein